MTSLADTIAATLDRHDVIATFDADAIAVTFCSCGFCAPMAEVTPNRHRAAILAEQEAQRTAAAVRGERVRHGHASRNGAHL
jgi:hypothetical protein